MTMQSNAFERKDRHLATDADLERPGAKRTGPDGNFALIVLAVARSRASSIFGFFVMAGLDPAIHENTESCNQGNDNVT
jgi:hypothetical protein